MGSTLIKFILSFIICWYFSLTLSYSVFLSLSRHFFFACFSFRSRFGFWFSFDSFLIYINSYFLFWRAYLSSLFLSAFDISFFGFRLCLYYVSIAFSIVLVNFWISSTSLAFWSSISWMILKGRCFSQNILKTFSLLLKWFFFSISMQ